MKKFFIKSMGCKSNQFEGSVIAQNLVSRGFSQVEIMSEADYFILNSCTVTHKSDNEAFYILRNVKHQNPLVKTILTGCIAQVEKHNLLEYDFIDFVLGNDDKFDMADFINSNNNLLVSDVMSKTDFREVYLSDTVKTRAFVKIQDGCDNRCSYCIIPFARGKSRSASFASILNQIESLYKANFKEIVLTGIHIGQWGLDIGKTFLDLLVFLENNSSISRIRLGSLNPLELSDEVLDFLASSKKFCPHFHLSLQSACNSTLQRMNRFYTVEDYLLQIENINKKFNLPFLGSDIIAGFVGETENDFLTTVENLKKSGLTQIHTFPYSIRKGTVAEFLPNHIDDKIKEYRANIIKQVSKEKYNQFLNKNLGTIHEVLIEKHLDKSTKFLKGMSENYLKILIKNNHNETLLNTIQKVKIVKNFEGKIFGEII